jgi:hypothetical protein
MPQRRIVVSSLALIFAAGLTLSSAQAQQRPPGPAQAAPPRGPAPAAQAPQVPPPQPYREIAVRLPQPASDASFATLLKQIAEIAMKKDRAALARLVVPTNFFWIGEVNGREGDKADKRKSGIDNLAAVLELDAKEGYGWDALAQPPAVPTYEPVPQRNGVVCSPARPVFDGQAAEQLDRAIGTGPFDWGAPIKAGIDVHAAADPNSPVTGKLGMYLVRVMPEQVPAGKPDQAPGLMRVVLTNGRFGYVQPDSLVPLVFDQICYIKDASGWKITGYYGVN